MCGALHGRSARFQVQFVSLRLTLHAHVCRYGNLKHFEKGVRELVGAPHPQVWEETNNE
jgi:hypothetical protein